MTQTYKLSDSVSARLIQIFQEAILMGLDGADLLRQVRVVVGEDGEYLQLDPAYEKQVRQSYEKYLEEAKKLQEESSNSAQQKIIFGA